jgi:hypothetical protein
MLNLAESVPAKLMDLTSIIRLQNHDGGWPYRKGGSSWTEPTVFALLAQSAQLCDRESVERGVAWLRAAQRQDGGWPPCPSVAQSTWVTAMAALLPAEQLGRACHTNAINWLMEQTGKETSLAYRLRNELIGDGAGGEETHRGWPFFPGAAAWVTPTAFGVLALEKARRHEAAIAVEQRILVGREFLLDRICKDGGWNYGRSNVLGVDAPSYPETTGQALLALNQVRSAKVDRALIAARDEARACQSSEGLSWLQLGLQAHGVAAAGPARKLECRRLVDSAVSILAQAALGGRNIFLE